MLERFTIANIKDIENTYQKLKGKKYVNASALYNVVKKAYTMGVAGEPISTKLTKMVDVVTPIYGPYGEVWSLVNDVYFFAYESFGIHLICEDLSKYEGFIDKDFLKRIALLDIPYIVEFNEVCEREMSAVAVRVHPDPAGGVRCGIDFWNGAEFRHYHSIIVHESYVDVLPVSMEENEENKVRFTYEDLIEFFGRSRRTKHMSRMLASSLNCITAYADAINSIPENVTRVERTYTTAVGISVVTDKVDTPIVQKDYAYAERIVDLNKYVQRRAKERKEWQGGHHASPTPHERSGYFRLCKNGNYVYDNGQMISVERGKGTHIYVRPCSVNGGASHTETIFKV